jgi:transposase/predicted RNA-binding Zn-ribbon protein involved in translation (DUF1610 family)
MINKHMQDRRETDQTVCKHCGSADIVRNGFARRIRADHQLYKCRSCKRQFTVRLASRVSYVGIGIMPFDAPERPPDGFSWASYNEAQTKEKLLFLDILGDLCAQLPEEPPNAIGRPRARIREMAFCMAAKLYEGLSSRRATSDLQIAMQKGYLRSVPHFNTVLKYFNDPAMSQMLYALITLSALPLREFETTFAVDASGLSSAFYSRWFDYRFGNLDGKQGKAHDWIKIHVICGVKTNIVAAIKVTDGKAGDSPQFPELLRKAAKHFKISEVCADKGYSSRLNMDTAFEVGAVPYIAFKENATGKALGSSAWKRMFHYYQFRREEFMARYHQRSNVESTFSMLKRKFSTKLMLKKDVGQLNEALAMVLCHNICVLAKEAIQNEVPLDFEGSAHLVEGLHINPDIPRQKV